MRIVSSNIQQVLDSNFGETCYVVKITIKEQTSPVFPETVLYYTDREGVVIDNQPYQNKIRSVSNLTFSLGAKLDGAEITIENVSKELGLTLNDQERYIDGAEVVISKAFKIGNTFETDALFIGHISGVRIDEESVSLSISSDMGRRGTSVAGRTITQRCIFSFKGDKCGWVATLPGNPSFCDHDLDSADGCKAHGNQHRFGGVPPFTNIRANNGYDIITGGGWGSGSGGGWCVHPETWILCITGQSLPYWCQAYNIKENDFFVTFDRFGQKKKTRVKKVIKGTTTRLYTITTALGHALTCSPSHPIITSMDDVHGSPISSLYVGHQLLCGTEENHKPIADKIEAVEIIDTQANVMIFQLSEPYHIFISGKEKGKGILSHNTKPVSTNPLPTQIEL